MSKHDLPVLIVGVTLVGAGIGLVSAAIVAAVCSAIRSKRSAK